MTKISADILIVDDARTNRLLLKKHLKDSEDYTFHEAEDGQVALDMLQEEPTKFNVVLLDLMMPKLDGLSLLRLIKKDRQLSLLPVIIQSAKTDPMGVSEAIAAGALYYITKPYNKDELQSIVHTAARDSIAYRQANDSLLNIIDTFGSITQGTFTCQTIEEAESLADLLANLYPTPKQIKTGLRELLLNGIEHGNLGISYDEKTILTEKNTWKQEVEERLNLPENRDKFIEVKISKSESNITLKITDMGNGFNWQEYMEPSPERMTDNHGRGIAMANMLSFTSLEYQGNGNIVIANFSKK